MGGRPARQVTVPAGDRAALAEAIAKAPRRFGLPAAPPVRSCSEAGRDGFWLHRALVATGIHNLVVDAASIAQPRRARRAKTDSLDAAQLLRLLVRHHAGEPEVWRVVRVPSVAEEDARRPTRERERLGKERTQHSNRIRSRVVTHGVQLPVTRRFRERLAAARQWDGTPLPPQLVAELEREYARWELVHTQILALDRALAEARRAAAPTAPVRRLHALRGIGEQGAELLVREHFWRDFRNRREVAAAAGLTGSPYRSGAMRREQGISKAGNARVRRLMVQLAWGWLRHQPHSALSRWYAEHFGWGSKRLRRIGIVALARKLLVALWRYLETGAVPAGARLRLSTGPGPA